MSDPFIYHMCVTSDFEEATKDGGLYYSPTFKEDKFIHATAEPKFLLEAGSHFYKHVKGEWICLKLDVSLLPENSVVYEAPAPVGAIEAVDYEAEHDLPEQPKFPHIYAGIPLQSVVETYKIVRNEEGEFLSIENLC